MKAIRYLSITLAIVALLAAVGWYLRNTLIQRITSPILKDYDVEVVDVSLDALGTSAASIGYLELVYDQGTTIVIEGLTLPVSTNENNLRFYSAEKVSVVKISREDDAPFEMARLIDQFLSLTDALPGTEIYVEEFTLAPYPIVQDLTWTLTDIEQTLSGTVESVAASLTAIRLEPTTYTVSFSLPGRSGIGVDRIGGRLQQDGLGVSIAGDSGLDLPGWEDIAKLTCIVPESLEFVSGTGDRGATISGSGRSAESSSFVLRPNQVQNFELVVKVVGVPPRNLTQTEAAVTTTDGQELAKETESTTLKNAR